MWPAAIANRRLPARAGFSFQIAPKQGQSAIFPAKSLRVPYV
jgi:hypothetical protein